MASITDRSQLVINKDARSVDAKGDYAYTVANAERRFYAYDVSDSDNPVFEDSISTGAAEPNQVKISGDHAFIAAGPNYLLSYDISDPSNLALDDSISTGLGSNTVALDIEGNYAYVVDAAGNKLVIFDISDPTNLVYKGQTGVNISEPRGVSAQGDYVFVSNYASDQITSYNVSDPTSPSYLYSLDTLLSGPRESKAVGSYLYIVSETNGRLVIYDISNPNNMSYVSTVAGLTTAWSIDVYDFFVYVGGRSTPGALYMVNVEDPQNPTLEDSTTDPFTIFWRPTGVVVHSDPEAPSQKLVYVVSQGDSNGLFVVFDTETPASSSSSSYSSSSSSNEYSSSHSSSSSFGDFGSLKYAPLQDIPNVSRTRFESIVPALQLDDIGNPHVAWTEDRGPETFLSYSFWDGTQWSWLRDTPIVSSMLSDATPSSFSLVLDGNSNPMVGFSIKDDITSSLVLATGSNGDWTFDTFDISYDADWVGLVNVGDLSVASSSSSSSSSGVTNIGTVLVAHDQDSDVFRFYRVSDAWTEIGNIDDSSVDLSHLRISGGSGGVWLASFNETNILYNLFNLATGTPLTVSFSEMTSTSGFGSIWAMDCRADSSGGLEILRVGWTSSTSGDSFVCSATIDETGVETPTNGSSVIVNRRGISNIVASEGYVINGFRKISVILGSAGVEIFCTGQESVGFTYARGVWIETHFDIAGLGNGIYWRDLETRGADGDMSFSNGADVYYFYRTSSTGFVMSEPTVVILNDQWVYISQYSSGVLSGNNVSNTYNELVGGVSKESEQRRLVSYSGTTAP